LSTHCKLLYALPLLFVSSITGFASPLNCKLLSLVPPGAGIVAGFENYPDDHRHGRLLLSTHNNRVDLADWLSITGVDSQRAFHEGIEVASTSAGSEMLTEHLLLVEGLFDKERIYKAAELNGAQRSEYEGAGLILIQPFTREREEMQDLRWLVILDNQIGIIGTPFLVKQAVQRYQTHAGIDQDLAERLSQLPRDVSSWNVLVSSPTDRRNIYLHLGSRWAGLVEDAEVLLVGARFGPKVRVDFLLHANGSRGAEFFKEKITSFEQVFASVLPGASQKRRSRDVSFEPGRVRGAIQLSQRQFEVWGDQGGIDLGSQGARATSHGE
jgi:hypothetical protein